MQTPKLLPAMIVSDSAPLAARLSAFLSRRGGYITVVDGPRMDRPDADAEIVRRNNIGARIQPKIIALAGLEDRSLAALRESLPQDRTLTFSGNADIDRVLDTLAPPARTVQWGHDNLGIGLLHALQSQANLTIREGSSCDQTYLAGNSGHLVVCERGDPLADVIAANYAFSLSAGLKIIEEPDDREIDRILERYYSIYSTDASPNELLSSLSKEIREIVGPIEIPNNGSMTFITTGLPYGVAYGSAPTTHLFRYPDLGITIANGFAAEQETSNGTLSAILIDPGQTDAPEIEEVAKVLKDRRVFVRGYSGIAATVRNVHQAVEYFPYDLLLIATHCGDADGYRWTYKYPDAEGIQRELVVDLSIGIATTDDPDMYSITQKLTSSRSMEYNGTPLIATRS